MLVGVVQDAATGALVGEVLNLMQKDIDLKTGMVTITGGGASRSRQIPIGPDTAKCLAEIFGLEIEEKIH